MRSNVNSEIQTRHSVSTGYFEGYASVVNVIDKQNDCVLPGAYTEAIKEFKKNPISVGMYFDHNVARPIGRWLQMQEDKYGLYVKGQFLFSLPYAWSVYAMLQKRFLGLSVGIQIVSANIQKARDNKMIRNIQQVKLSEISVVHQPANEQARIFI